MLSGHEQDSKTEVGIYKRKILRKKHAFYQENNKIQEKRKKTRFRPRKKERKQDLDQEKRKKTRSSQRKKEC